MPDATSTAAQPPPSRLRRWMMPGLLLLPVVFICGKLLLTGVFPADRSSVLPIFELGYPWQFARSEWSGLGKIIEHGELSWSIFAADCAVMLAAMAAFECLICWLWRRNGYRFCFSLRTLLCLVAICALLCGWVYHWYEGWKREQDIINRKGSGWQVSSDNDASTAIEPFVAANCSLFRGPEWCRQLLPEVALKIFYRTSDITVASEVTESEAQALATTLRQFSYLKTLSLKDISEPIGELSLSNTAVDVVAPQSVEAIKRTAFFVPGRIRDIPALQHLEEVEFINRGGFGGGRIGPSTIEAIESGEVLQALGMLPNLLRLDLSNFPVTDAGLSHLANCRQLRSLELDHTQITDNGLMQLYGLAELETLGLEGDQISDFGLRRFSRSTKLVNVSLGDTPITDRALDTIVQWQDLRSLSLGGCLNIHDAGFNKLLNLTALQELRIRRLKRWPKMSKKTFDALVTREVNPIQIFVDGRMVNEYSEISDSKPHRLPIRSARIFEPPEKLKPRVLSLHPIDPTWDD
jgi:hypothetical protein